MVSRTVVVGLGLVLLAGCASASDPSSPSDSPNGSARPSATAEGNGTVYTSQWDTEAGTLTITGHPIGADGSLGPAARLLSEPALRVAMGQRGYEQYRERFTPAVNARRWQALFRRLQAKRRSSRLAGEVS
jgi:hypothetical protein